MARVLVDSGVPVTSSLAGRVANPRLPVGDVRIGGFGGVRGLVAALRDGEYTHIVDATHPFAVGMRANAAAAAREADVPVLRLARPGWASHPDAGEWTWVDDYDAARSAAGQLGERPFLTSGRQTLTHFTSWDVPALVRVVEPLDFAVPSAWRVILDRGPFTRAQEIDLMADHGVDVLITKDSGGAYTSAKLDAARELGVPVVVVRRPVAPSGMREVADVNDVMRWLGEAPSAS